MFFRPSLATIAGHPFFTHDPKKIPQNLPSCCTHVAPDWQEDRNGYLVPILAEVEENRSSKHSSRRKEKSSSSSQRSDQAPLRDTNSHSTEQLLRGKENTLQTQKSSKQFEIYSDGSQRRQASVASEQHRSRSSRMRSSERELRQEEDIELVSQKTNEADDITDKLTACAIQDCPKDSPPERQPNGNGEGSDADVIALNAMYSRLKDLGTLAEASSNHASNKPATPIDAGGAKTWVTRYVDYTSKYGLGFLFNNGR